MCSALVLVYWRLLLGVKLSRVANLSSISYRSLIRVRKSAYSMFYSTSQWRTFLLKPCKKTHIRDLAYKSFSTILFLKIQAQLKARNVPSYQLAWPISSKSKLLTLRSKEYCIISLKIQTHFSWARLTTPLRLKKVITLLKRKIMLTKTKNYKAVLTTRNRTLHHQHFPSKSALSKIELKPIILAVLLPYQ